MEFFEDCLKKAGYKDYTRILNTDFLISNGEYIIKPELDKQTFISFKLIHSYVGRIKTSLHIGLYLTDLVEAPFSTYAANEPIYFFL